ncbi:RNA polymerase sigma factor [Actinomadura chibensis]|uniref:Sigma-70 family RNA polymerase sigma factor n=1 Tax=Actinomadura chibensis TaxID=392828 RepID=A0A5D0NIM7_9ACTN|nr:sigma-70 family RNA polymerase sigma factor [Actinomadura chibensis]TYB44218.1 sigma-70 family RNA polymerase sigma factor [Actinomadura chibensis]
MKEEPAHLRAKYDEEICELFVAHAARLENHLVRLGASRTLAEHVVQDSFLATRLRWFHVRGLDCPRAYLYRVAENRTRKLLGREGGRCVPHPDPHELAAHPEPVRRVASPELRLVLDEAIGRLPAREGTAARLFYLADHSVSQAASRMGISKGTVTKYLESARGRLRRDLGEDFTYWMEGEL